MRRSLITAVVAGIMLPAAFVASPASATNIGNEGCTPGYWKNHTDNWEEATPSSLVKWIYRDAGNTAYGDITMLAALSLKGGPGTDGAQQILLRAAVAAWLNAAHEGLGYPYRRFTEPEAFVADVNAALASGDRATMLALATKLDLANNLGCPLN